VSGSNKGNDLSGSLWRMDIDTGLLKRVIRFEHLKPEGVATAKNDSDVMVCFDQGCHNPSQIALVRNVR
jgi:hypothetical protein